MLVLFTAPLMIWIALRLFSVCIIVFDSLYLQINHLYAIQDGTETRKTFLHVPSAIEAEEAEEIGVEHLLRDIKD